MTTVVVPNTLAEDVLAANRAGRLAASQRSSWVAIERAWLGGYRLGAVAFAAVGVAVLLGLGAKEPATTRYLGIAGCFLVAGVLAWASYVPPRRLAIDLQEGRLEIVEGHVRKRMLRSGSSTGLARHYFDVGGHRYQCTRAQYEAAPDMGSIRLFVLPRTHKVINLEPLIEVASAPVPGGAPMAAVQALDRPSEADIVGTWRGPGMTATFSPDGSASAQLAHGVTVSGRWSIDPDGRLRVTGLGEGDEALEVAVAGDVLEVRMGGARLPFQRVSA